MYGETPDGATTPTIIRRRGDPGPLNDKDEREISAKKSYDLTSQRSERAMGVGKNPPHTLPRKTNLLSQKMGASVGRGTAAKNDRNTGHGGRAVQTTQILFQQRKKRRAAREGETKRTLSTAEREKKKTDGHNKVENRGGDNFLGKKKGYEGKKKTGTSLRPVKGKKEKNTGGGDGKTSFKFTREEGKKRRRLSLLTKKKKTAKRSAGGGVGAGKNRREENSCERDRKFFVLPGKKEHGKKSDAPRGDAPDGQQEEGGKEGLYLRKA